MESKFTPGPWKVDNSINNQYRYDAEIRTEGDGVNWLIATVHKQNDAYEPNAALIAAAPELYEELRVLLGNIEVFNQNTSLGEFRKICASRIEIAQEILKKARGEK